MSHVECWAYVIFVYRIDKSGQFISYRKFQQWRNAAASQIQNCLTISEMQSLWTAIEDDYLKYNQQYDQNYQPFLRRIAWKLGEKLQDCPAIL